MVPETLHTVEKYRPRVRLLETMRLYIHADLSTVLLFIRSACSKQVNTNSIYSGEFFLQRSMLYKCLNKLHSSQTPGNTVAHYLISYPCHKIATFALHSHRCTQCLLSVPTLSLTAESRGGQTFWLVGHGGF